MIDFLKRFLRREPASEPELRTHDYTKRYWGHDYSFRPTAQTAGIRGVVLGWGLGLRSGDLLLLQNGAWATTRYRIVTVVYKSDPRDMFRAEVIFAPRDAGAGRLSIVEEEGRLSGVAEDGGAQDG